MMSTTTSSNYRVTGRPLAPKTNSLTITAPQDAKLPPRRKPTYAACLPCRKRKIRCDAQRPACAVCRSRHQPCHYDTGRGETPGQARKRKLEPLRHRSSASEEIYNILQTRPESEALEIFRRIRDDSDPDSLIRLVKNGDMLMDLTLLPETRLRYEFPFKTSMPVYLQVPQNEYLPVLIYEESLIDGNNGQSHDSTRNTLQDEADFPYLRPYHAATIIDPRLSAVRPSEWTAITADNDLMRSLMHHFFLYDYQWHATFQKDYFLDDMASGGQELCSSLLVNAILAFVGHSCARSPNHDEYRRPRTLEHLFVAEARRLWDLEAGKNNLTTVQAGPLLYLALAACGMDRIGRSYLLQSVIIAERLDIFNHRHEKRVDGSFNQWYFLEPPLVDEPPKVPLPDPGPNNAWYGEIWIKYPSSDRAYPTHFGVTFRAQSQFNIILNEIARKSFSSQGDSPMYNVDAALDIHKKMVDWYVRLPEQLRPNTIVFPAHLKLHFEPQDTFLAQPLVELANICQRDVTSGRELTHFESIRSTLVLCMKGLSDQGRNQFIGRALFQLTRDSLSTKDKALIDKHIYTNQQAQALPSQIRADQVHSNWPVNIIGTPGELEGQRLTALLYRFEKVTLQSSGTSI
ncbi:hypothetical protein FSARC_8876 [Fusarium sarcochroum]|uniref:Zn(2)-C6 fungal-type domain-containing protein n=1 Tax=Fusarium sarcochroum TaxID=1208366 RepID=A0A8H4TSH8_9HYPO|nr:hypothetical protein FSARC_8876 [Fusarium sarcochroum]